MLTCEPDRWVLHGDLRTDVSIDPFHGRAFFGNRTLGHQVVHVVRPVLDGRVPHSCILLGDDLDHCGVQRIRLVNRSCTPFDVVNVRAFVSNDERALKLTHVFRVDAEVRLQRDLHVNTLGHVDERPTGPHGSVEGCEFVVTGRNHGTEVLFEDLWVFPQTRVGVEEDDTLTFELFVDLVVDDLGLVLRGDTRNQTLLFRLGNPQPVVRVLNVFRQVFPRLRLTLSRTHKVLDVVEVDTAKVGTPVRHRLLVK